jgi:peptidoglycan/xylan/chitin deacetylase (PgdA/CDA1 family)
MSLATEHSVGTKRWAAKKGARLAVAGASLPLTLLPGHANRLRVLTYHRFADEMRSPFSVAPRVLERQMAWLARKGLATGTDEALAVVEGRAANRRAVVVTMDDGDPTVIRDAAPIFERHRIPYVVYIVPGRIGRADHMSVAELRTLADLGVEIGSHTMTHRSVTQLSARVLAEELLGSKKAIEDITGRAVTSFAYPFGTLRDFDRRTADALSEAGYRLAFTSQHGALTSGQDAMMLPRVKIEGGDPDWMFRAVCSGALDQWRLIDAGLSGLQKPVAADLSIANEAAPSTASGGPLPGRATCLSRPSDPT